jgi:serine/threonine-protein kinase
MATVYLAHDPRFMREVALKALPHQFTHDPMFRTRFEREAQTIAALEHPAIVPVHDFGEEDGQPFIVMRYMSGGSLSDRLRQGNMPLEAATAVLSRIASALDRAHSMGIIHRDLKPGNILFDQYEDAYLADFGIAKIAEATAALTGSALMGTPTYMSPEQVKGEGIDGRSDIYSLGIILYEMLSGSQPYEATTPWGILSKHVNDPVPSILERKGDLPPQIDAIVTQAMAKKVAERFQTATELATAVTLITQQRPSPPTTVVAPSPPQETSTITKTAIEPEPEEVVVGPTETAAEPEPLVGELTAQPEPELAEVITEPIATAAEPEPPVSPEPVPAMPTKVVSPKVETAVTVPGTPKTETMPRWVWAVGVLLVLLLVWWAIGQNRQTTTNTPVATAVAVVVANEAGETISDFIQAKWDEEFRVTDLGYSDDVWAVVMSQGSPYGRQTWRTHAQFPGEFIQAKWDEGFRVTNLAYGNGVWAVVMAEESPYGRQTYQTLADFPGDYIQEKWNEGFRVTSLTYGNGLWGVVLSQESPYGRQIWQTLKEFPGDYIQEKWDEDFRVTSLAYGHGLWAVVMSEGSPYGRQTWRTLDDLPGDYIRAKWDEGFRVTNLTYGNGVWAVVLSQASPYGRQTWRVLPDF